MTETTSPNSFENIFYMCLFLIYTQKMISYIYIIIYIYVRKKRGPTFHCICASSSRRFSIKCTEASESEACRGSRWPSHWQRIWWKKGLKIVCDFYILLWFLLMSGSYVLRYNSTFREGERKKKKHRAPEIALSSCWSVQILGHLNSFTLRKCPCCVFHIVSQ